MTEKEENELICEKLLCFTKHCGHPDCNDWLTPDGLRYWNNPDFTTWAQAGLLLDALAKAGQRPDVGYWNDEGWTSFTEHNCMTESTCLAPTGPLAVRLAALEYVRSLS